MDAESFLSSTVEVAIGIIGFAGLVAAIQQRRLSEWSDLHRSRLEVLFTASAGALVFSLLPAVFGELGIER